MKMDCFLGIVVLALLLLCFGCAVGVSQKPILGARPVGEFGEHLDLPAEEEGGSDEQGVAVIRDPIVRGGVTLERHDLDDLRLLAQVFLKEDRDD